MGYLIMGISLAISEMKIPFKVKQEISKCTFYGVQARANSKLMNTDLTERFKICKKKHLKK